jgi:acyl-CoA synthetase (AMP-forming)/AMP-acid ligase II
MTKAEAHAPTTVRALIERQAAERPDAVYAVATESAARLTFGELAQTGRAVGALLRTHGVGPGDTVSLVLPNGLQTLRLLLGALHAGCCVNPVNLLSQPEQMRHVLTHSDCKLVFVARDWEARVRTLLATIDRPVAVVVTDADATLDV